MLTTIEHEWVDAAAGGDTAAFERIVRASEGFVYSMALRMTGNTEDAYDLSQEVFIKLFRSLGGYNGDSAFSTWFYRLTVNMCIDYKRGTKRRPAADDENALLNLPAGDSDSPESCLERRELSRAIHNALEELSAEHRCVVVMRDIEGLSYSEIAAALDCGEGTVKSRLSRARARLRESLVKLGNIPSVQSSKLSGEVRQ